MKWKKQLVAACLLSLASLMIAPCKQEAFAQMPVPTGQISLQIDPLRNQLSVLIDGVIYKKYPIAMGKPDTPTPVGDWIVINKYKNWGSGFGTRWIGLSVPWGNYGIHGTNKPHSIGLDLSHGCIRMFNRHVEELYEWVSIGTPVSVIGHPLREPSLDPRRLAAGDSGSDVQLIQTRLRSAGFFKGECNGRFGKATEQALKAFEEANGLPVDGVVGLHDYRALGLFE